MDQDKKAMGPIVLGKTEGSESSTFLPFSHVEDDKRPVLATEKFVQQSVSSAIDEYSTLDQGGVNAQYVASEIEKAIKSIPGPPDLSDYAKKGDLQSATSGLAKTSELTAFATRQDITDATKLLATKEYVDGQIAALKKYCDDQFSSIKKSLLTIGIKL